MELNRKLLNHLISHITDPDEPVDKRDFSQAKELIDNIKELKGGKMTKKGNSVIQSIIFDKKVWDLSNAKKWLKKHGLKHSVDEKPNFLRFRQVDPKLLKKDGYNKYRTIKLNNDVEMIICAKSSPLKGGKLQVNVIQKMIKDSYLDNATDDIEFYKLDRDLSTPEAKVYYNQPLNQVVICNRGTKEAMDWGNNLVYTVNSLAYKSTPRYNRAVDVQKKAISKYGKVDTNVGHSQSAIITRGLLEDGLTNEIINVNGANKGEKPLAHEYNIRSSGDVVSMLKAPSQTVYNWLYPSSKKKNITVKSTSWNPLTEHSSDILSRLPPTQYIGR